jgi:hypothetical protein
MSPRRAVALRDAFEARYIPEPMSGCWLWIGAHNLAGYGKIRKDGQDFLAHRLAYEFCRGPIGDACASHLRQPLLCKP